MGAAAGCTHTNVMGKGDDGYKGAAGGGAEGCVMCGTSSSDAAVGCAASGGRVAREAATTCEGGGVCVARRRPTHRGLASSRGHARRRRVTWRASGRERAQAESRSSAPAAPPRSSSQEAMGAEAQEGAREAESARLRRDGTGGGMGAAGMIGAGGLGECAGTDARGLISGRAAALLQQWWRSLRPRLAFTRGERERGGGCGFVHLSASCTAAAARMLREAATRQAEGEHSAGQTQWPVAEVTADEARACSVFAKLEREYAQSDGRAEAAVGGLLLPRHDRAAFIDFVRWMASGEAGNALAMEQVAMAVRTFNAETRLVNWCADLEIADLLEQPTRLAAEASNDELLGGNHTVPGRVRAVRAATDGGVCRVRAGREDPNAIDENRGPELPSEVTISHAPPGKHGSRDEITRTADDS